MDRSVRYVRFSELPARLRLEVLGSFPDAAESDGYSYAVAMPAGSAAVEQAIFLHRRLASRRLARTRPPSLPRSLTALVVLLCLAMAMAAAYFYVDLLAYFYRMAAS